MCQLCSRVCAHLCKRVGGGLSARAGFGDNTEIAQNKTIDVKPDMAMGKSSNLYHPLCKSTHAKLKSLNAGRKKRDPLMADERVASTV